MKELIPTLIGSGFAALFWIGVIVCAVRAYRYIRYDK